MCSGARDKNEMMTKINSPEQRCEVCLHHCNSWSNHQPNSCHREGWGSRLYLYRSKVVILAGTEEIRNGSSKHAHYLKSIGLRSVPDLTFWPTWQPARIIAATRGGILVLTRQQSEKLPERLQASGSDIVLLVCFVPQDYWRLILIDASREVWEWVKYDVALGVSQKGRTDSSREVSEFSHAVNEWIDLPDKAFGLWISLSRTVLQWSWRSQSILWNFRSLKERFLNHWISRSSEDHRVLPSVAYRWGTTITLPWSKCMQPVPY